MSWLQQTDDQQVGKQTLEEVYYITPKESLTPKLENCRLPELQSNLILGGLNDG